MQLLGAELREAVRTLHLLHGVAVVEAHVGLVAVLADLHPDVPEAVELGSGLADLGGEELVVPDDLVLADGAPGRRGGDADHPLALPEHRHAGVVLVTELVRHVVLDRGKRARHHLGLLVPVGRAGLVTLAPDGMRPPDAPHGGVHHVAVHPGLAGAVLPVVLAGRLRGGHREAGNDRERGREQFLGHDRCSPPDGTMPARGFETLAGELVEIPPACVPAGPSIACPIGRDEGKKARILQ